MKKCIFTLSMVLATIVMMAQTPNMFNYQAIARNASGETLNEQNISIEISILDGATAVFTETHNVTTSQFGLFTLKIGNGTSSLGSIGNIDFSTGAYSLQVSVDENGGSNFTVMGTSQLISVPYAMHAKTAESISGGITESDPVYGAWDKSTGISITESQISDLGNYIETETDPIFNSSQASNITATDITNLSNLTGTNTGDQDLTGLASKAALGDSISQLRSEIPDVSGFLTNETDPTFTSSQAHNITTTDINNLSNLSGVNTGDQDIFISNDTLNIDGGSSIKLPNVNINSLTFGYHLLATVTNSYQKVGLSLGTITKNKNNTVLEVTIHGHFYVQSLTSVNSCVFQLRVNGVESPFYYNGTGSLRAGAQIGNIQSLTFTGIFTNIPAGNVTIDLYAKTLGGTGTASNAWLNSGNFEGNFCIIKEYYAGY